MLAGLTAEQRSALLQAARRANLHRAEDGATAVAKADRRFAIPLSFAQQRLLFLAQMDGGSEAYHVPLGFRLRGPLDERALREALNALVARHEALRTTFVLEQGDPVQRIGPAAAGFALAIHDLRGRADAEEELRYLASQEMSAPFDLSRGPLIRGRLIHLRADEAVLLLTMHHIVSDGWSCTVLLRELGALYRQAPLPSLPVQYADYAVWQRRFLSGDRLAAQSAYWESRLKGAPSLLELPTDRSRPAHQQYEGDVVAVTVDAELTARLKALGQLHGATLFMMILAGWSLLLSRLSGQEEVVVGTPTANRGQSEIEGLIGLFVNTLALRLELPGELSVAALLGHVKQRALEAQEHQGLPFEQVVELIKPERSLSCTPVFQVMFDWQNNEAALDLGGALSVDFEAPSCTIAKFDLSLGLKEVDGRIVGGLRYATALFDRETVERHVGYLREVLWEMTQDVSQTVQQVRLLPAPERERLLVEWNAPAAEFPADHCVHELFEVQVARSPDAIAVRFDDQRLSYAELNRRANQLAHHLRTLGVGPDARVALCLDRGCEMIVGLLAVLKAGGAYVPLDPAYPAERLAFMIEDSTPQVLLTQRAVLPSLGRLPDRLPVLVLDDRSPPWAASPVTNPEPAAAGLTPANLAYMIYTSGSTGTPKGVLIEHRALVQHCLECRDFYGLTPEDRVLQFASLSFDAAIEQILPPLLSGACVVLREALVWDPVEFQKKLAEFGLTVINLPPAYWHQLADGWANAVEPVSAHQLRLVIIGGDAMSLQTLELWQKAPLNSVRLLNAYGPTEAVITATSFEIPARNIGDPLRERIPIGRPRGGRQIYLLDRRGRLAPLGVTGELHIGGGLLARGYHNRPELTAEKFIANPFSKEAGARLYRTGDRARYLPDGAIEFLGRLDHQVKIRGHRIELGEIEAALAQHPAVREAVVLALAEESRKRLVAYVVADSDDQLASTLRAHLAARVPDYMVPAAFVRLDAFPLTPNGKLDRRALPAPDDEAHARETYEAPQGETETALAAIWAELLGVERISRNDDFFNLGGHSLLALRVISEINKTLKLHLNVPTFFMNPTIKRLAREFEHSHHVRTEPRVVTLRTGRTGLPIYLMGARPAEHRIAQLINGDRPIFAIDTLIPVEWLSAIAAPDHAAPSTIERMGALYGNALFAHAGSSPCVIAGYSLGGKLAFEAAHGLQRSGGKVAYVLLVDASAFASSSFTLGPALESFRWIWRRAAARTVSDPSFMRRMSASLSDSSRLARWLLRRIPDMTRHRFDLVRRRLDALNNRSAPELRPSGYFDDEGIAIDASVMTRLTYLAARSWRRLPLDSSGVLIRAKNQHDMLPGRDPINGWGGLFTRGLEIVQTEGDHDSMFNDANTAELARQLNLILDRYEPAGSPARVADGHILDHTST
ncbi:amino acid adenylation domain-containing protein [Acidocella sp.]|jgi:amino acid adenylation domain-containing protein|uniref:amino acid adenylation domain-containing protein n=1 Tax=Acidocella sp. TaxID=50710 RepID=UPI002F419846